MQYVCTSFASFLFDHPMSRQIVDPKQNAGDDPRERINVHYRLDGVMGREDEDYPENSEDADAEDGQERRYDALPASSDCSGKNFDGDPGNEERRDAPENRHSFVQDRPIGGEKGEKRSSEEKKDDRKQDRHHRTHREAHHRTFAHPPVLGGTVVLSAEHRHGDAETVDAHPEKRVDLAICGIGRDDVGSQTVDRALDDNIGD